jgi:hypothetical protein
MKAFLVTLLTGVLVSALAFADPAGTPRNRCGFTGDSDHTALVGSSLKYDAVDAGVLNVEGQVTMKGPVIVTGSQQAWLAAGTTGNKTLAWQPAGAADWTYSSATGYVTIGTGITPSGMNAAANGKSCTLNGGSPATCTATVTASARCVAVTVGTTAAAAKALTVNLATTTLTVTAADGSTEAVNIWCDR